MQTQRSTSSHRADRDLDGRETSLVDLLGGRQGRNGRRSSPLTNGQIEQLIRLSCSKRWEMHMNRGPLYTIVVQACGQREIVQTFSGG